MTGTWRFAMRIANPTPFLLDGTLSTDVARGPKPADGCVNKEVRGTMLFRAEDQGSIALECTVLEYRIEWAVIAVSAFGQRRTLELRSLKEQRNKGVAIDYYLCHGHSCSAGVVMSM